MPKANESPADVSPDQIVGHAQAILAELDRPVRLAWLGQELNRSLGISIRNVLGQRPLGDLILEVYGDQYEVQGFGPYKEIGKKGTWQYSQKYLHFVQDFWNSFEQPLEAGLRRWLLPDGSGRSVDSADRPSIEGVIEIEPHFILDPAAEQEPKGRYVRHNITTWAKAHNVDLSIYEVKPKETDQHRSTDSRSSGATVSGGLKALKGLIDAVPPDERSRYTLSLDLVARLLNLG